MEVLGCFVRINKKIKSLLSDFFIPKNEYTNTLIIYSPKGNTNHIKWFASIPPKTLFVEEIFLNSKKKYRVWYPNQLFTRTTHEQAIKLLNKKPLVPWLWIGSCEDEEVSSRLDEFMVVGNIITLELLNDLFPSIMKFQYLCPSTLELQDFPISGIQIKEDDSFNENSKKTS
jgi:hypothetical protein